MATEAPGPPSRKRPQYKWFPGRDGTMRTTAQNAHLALLLEVSSTPKPGNVDRDREYPTLRFEHFLAGAVGAQAGLEMAAGGAPVGAAFERAVAGMADQEGGNTQFGALLLIVPLVVTAQTGTLTKSEVSSVLQSTSVEDAANFYRAFDHVDVSVRDPPAGMESLDVRRGSEAVPAVEERSLTLQDVMDFSAEWDGVAREWVQGYERTFSAANAIASGTGPIPDRVAATYLWLLAREPDPFVAINHGQRTAHSVMVRAQEAREGDPELVEAFAESLVEEGINPGTTADISAAGLFLALERGDVTV